MVFAMLADKCMAYPLTAAAIFHLLLYCNALVNERCVHMLKQQNSQYK